MHSWENIWDRYVYQNIIPTTLFRIVCKMDVISKIIVKSNPDPDDKFLEELLGINGF